MRHPLKILLTAFLVFLLSDSGAMASGKPPRKIGDNWEERSAISQGFSEAPSARGAPLGSGKKMPGNASLREEEENDLMTEFEDSVSTMAYEQTSATLFDDKDLKKHIKRLYLEVRPTNYELLYGHASSFISKGLFNRFDQGVAIHWPGSMPFDEEKISDVLGSLKSATKFRVSIEGGISDESSLESIWDCLQGLSKIQEMDLSGCGLTNQGVDYVMDSVGNPKGLTRLDLRRNHLTAEIVPVIRKRFPKLEELEMDENPLALKRVPTGALVPQGSAGLKTGAPERLLRAGPEIPAIARGYEEIYLRFLSGKLVHRDPHFENIEFPIRDLANPLGGEFDLSRCGGNVGERLSINTGYRKGKKAANTDKLEIWLAPRFLIER